jgi:tetratricopeptide (TPR) repeat protein
MVGRLRSRQLQLAVVGGIIATIGVAVAVQVRRRPPVPEIPRIAPSAFVDREVQQDVAALLRQVEDEPWSAEAWGEYGIVLRAYRQHPQANRCFETAAALDPTDGRWPYLLGHHLAESDPIAAVEWLERAVERTVPENARDTIRAKLAEVLLLIGRPADALAVVGPNPQTPRARLAAARAAAAIGDDRTAAEFLHELTDHPLAARQTLLLRAEIARRQGRTSYAAYLGDRAADLPETVWPDPLADPIRSRDRSPGGRLDEAARLLRDGRPAEAERLLRPLTAKPDASDPRAFVGLAEARQAQGDRAGALEALHTAIRLDPKNLAANYQIGLIHFDNGERLWATGHTHPAQAEFRQAVNWLDKALALNPNFGKAILLKGVALHRFLGQPEDGLLILRRFVQQRPEVSEGHLLLGQALVDSGQLDAAVASLRRAAELAPLGDRRAIETLAKLTTTDSR